MENNISKEELIGYHKGSINTLLAERNELYRIIQVTESLIQAHIKELEKLGVKIQSSSAQDSQNTKLEPKLKKP